MASGFGCIFVCVCVCRQYKPGVKFDIDIELGMFWGCGRQGEVKFSINMLHRGGNNFVMLYIRYTYTESWTQTHWRLRISNMVLQWTNLRSM